ncbi:MAG TPA: bifunctional diguanylate cyclase/phosphodiesterase, partial [Thioalkalivibrio sp.]|nr:bifunctional diguanylate cyclase/phosphodiesterase [Thioalkalivibrio sp.]
RLSRGRDAEDLVARLGGDEFLVLFQGRNSGQALAPARALLESLAEPLAVDGAQVVLRPSLGLAASPEHGTTPADLMRRADIALNHAKQRHTRLEVYQRGDDEHYQRRLQVVAALKGLAGRGELSLVYQPKLDLASGQVRQVEALIRWEHPLLGFVSPAEFIPLAEQSGHIRELTAWVLRSAITQIRCWHDAGLCLHVGLNLSALDLLDTRLPDSLCSTLEAADLPADFLTLEITETFVMQDIERSMEGLARLRALGVQISIDDFGTGHSSLAQLRRLGAQELKIDRSFVSALEQGQDDGRIVETIISLGHHLNMRVVAEGVENALSLGQLKSMGCDAIQGYHIARPMQPQALEAWLHDFAASPQTPF